MANSGHSDHWRLETYQQTHLQTRDIDKSSHSNGRRRKQIQIRQAGPGLCVYQAGWNIDQHSVITQEQRNQNRVTQLLPTEKKQT
jgi:hypothetical protein